MAYLRGGATKREYDITGSINRFNWLVSDWRWRNFINGFVISVLLQSVRSIIEKNVKGKEILDELDSGMLSRKKRISMVQILVAYIIEHFGDR
jgi:hypothetical protein